MLYNFLVDYDMSSDKTTDWYQVGTAMQAVSIATIQVNTKSVDGTKNGTVAVQVSNDSASTGKEYVTLSTTDLTAAADAIGQAVESPYAYFRLVYTKNDITAGTMNGYYHGVRITGAN